MRVHCYIPTLFRLRVLPHSLRSSRQPAFNIDQLNKPKHSAEDRRGSPSSPLCAAEFNSNRVASKIQPDSGSPSDFDFERNGSNSTVKRPFSSVSPSMENEPDAKRMAAAVAAAAAAAAANAADPFGALRSPGMQGRGPMMGMPAASMMNLGPISTEEVAVPDKMVGLIIGRGGEQISRLQAESGAKIQMAPDSAGLPDRTCTITGSREAIGRARELINNIVQTRGGPRDAGPPSVESLGGQHNVGIDLTLAPNVEVMIPGPKVGLIIGKGGETIKQLQERSGTRMVVVQDGPQQENEKPLRIYGDPQKVEHAKQLVYDLIAEKEMEVSAFSRGQRFGSYGGGGPQQTIEVAVPRSAVGVVIGKNGEMIKKIQNETGARVQFQQGRDDNPEERMCALTGTMNQIEDARQRIEELIESVLARDSQMGRGRGRTGGGSTGGSSMNGAPYGRSPGGGSSTGGGWGEYGPGVGRSGGPSIGMARNGQDKVEYQFLVPSTKTGIIIGKGGETIKQINQQSGAFCELDRRPPPNPNEKIFIIRGSHEQVELAKRMISEKLGLGPMGAPPAQGYPMGQNQNAGAYAAQGWGAAAYQQWPGQPNDPSKADPNAANAAAWAAYYQQQQFYQQPGSGAPSAQSGNPGQPEGNSGSVPVNPQTGQPDYTAQWIQYYRSIGAMKDAEALEQQLKASKEIVLQGMGNPAVSAAPAAAPAAAPTQDYSAQWAAYYRSIGKIGEAEAIEAQARMKQSGQGGQGPGQAGSAAQYGAYPGAGSGGSAAAAAGYYGGQPGGGQPQGGAAAYGYQGYGGYGQAPSDGQ
ncbi:far upstream element-binding protein 1-like isoform X6 [Daphnia pulex]|uniref:far upstream element-binding protein 1-like isoform X6 n=1 Tax=Daphnia pulex TaxID=6669 RepID=UPI001EE151B4|nr:far upstream element-binding protein 1-like isoform X6 [Daphnia pulex]